MSFLRLALQPRLVLVHGEIHLLLDAASLPDALCIRLLGLLYHCHLLPFLPLCLVVCATVCTIVCALTTLKQSIFQRRADSLKRVPIGGRCSDCCRFGFGLAEIWDLCLRCHIGYSFGGPFRCGCCCCRVGFHLCCLNLGGYFRCGYCCCHSGFHLCCLGFCCHRRCSFSFHFRCCHCCQRFGFHLCCLGVCCCRRCNFGFNFRCLRGLCTEGNTLRF